jgi:hypothetical protein
LEREKIVDLNAAHRIVQKWMNVVSWPTAFLLADPAFEIVEPQDMTVDQYQMSQALDYDDISP